MARQGIRASRVARSFILALPVCGALLSATTAHAVTVTNPAAWTDEFNQASLDAKWWAENRDDNLVSPPITHFKSDHVLTNQTCPSQTGSPVPGLEGHCLQLLADTVGNTGGFVGSAGKIISGKGTGHSTNYFHMLYGSVQVTAKLPSVDGRWPGFWMVGKACDDSFTSLTACKWPTAGSEEIDLAEFQSNTEGKVFSTVHWGTTVGVDNYDLTNVNLPISGNTVSQGTAVGAFHKYKIDWQSTYIKWYIDGALVKTMTTHVPASPETIYLGYGFLQNGSGTFSGSDSIWIDSMKAVPKAGQTWTE